MSDPFGGMAVSQGEAAVLRRQLELLAGQDRDPRIAEMARDVLAGKVDLRGALLGERYREAVDAGMAAFSAWYRDLDEDERAEQRRLAEEYMAEARREDERPRRRQPVDEEDDWEPPDSIYRKPPRR